MILSLCQQCANRRDAFGGHSDRYRRKYVVRIVACCCDCGAVGGRDDVAQYELVSTQNQGRGHMKHTTIQCDRCSAPIEKGHTAACLEVEVYERGGDADYFTDHDKTKLLARLDFCAKCFEETIGPETSKLGNEPRSRKHHRAVSE